jgi:endo-1,4-beta-xylanase
MRKLRVQSQSKKSRFLGTAIWTALACAALNSSAQAVPPAPVNTVPEMTLRQAAEARGFIIGGAINANVFDPDAPDLGEGVAREYNLIVTENTMKWGPINNSPGEFNFNLADLFLKYADKNKQILKGHTLVWHEQLPKYVNNIETKEALIKEMKDHITGVVSHFKGKIPVWDVVNESISDTSGNPNPYRDNSPFIKLIGPEFIEIAFRTAHAADPDAKLYYNDYNVEGINGKSDAMYEMAKGLLAKGVPIHGVGFQTHVDMNFSVEYSRMKENLERFRKLGLDVQLTEVDVQVKGDAPIAERYAKQAQTYADLLRVCLEVKCNAFVMWGYTDLYSWRSGSKPLIFDVDYKPKPAYFALRDVLINTPK